MWVLFERNPKNMTVQIHGRLFKTGITLKCIFGRYYNIPFMISCPLLPWGTITSIGKVL